MEERNQEDKNDADEKTDAAAGLEHLAAVTGTSHVRGRETGLAADREPTRMKTPNPERSRDTVLVVLTEGDVLIDGGTLYRVQHGEVSVTSTGALDERNGELAEVSLEAVQLATSAGNQVFNTEDL